MTPVPIVFVGPRGGYRGRERTLVASLLERGRALFEVDIVPQPPGQHGVLTDIVSRIRETVRKATFTPAAELGESQPLPALVGYSIGAQAAAVFAAENPGLVSSVTLIAAWMSPSEKMRELCGVVRALELSGSHGDAGLSPLGTRVAHLVLASSHGWPAATNVSLLRTAAIETSALLGMCQSAELTSSAAQITDPALIIGCSLDEFASVQQSRLLFGTISDSRYAEIESGHLVCIERPAELASLIDPFVSNPHRHPGGTRIIGHQP